MEQNLIQKIAQAAATAVKEAAGLYATAAGRMAWGEIEALWGLIGADKREAAMKQIRACMTPDELVAEKKLLADAAEEMAAGNADAWAMARNVGWTIIKAVIGTIVSGGLGAILL